MADTKEVSKSERLINSGRSLKLNHFDEEVVVKELTLEAIIRISGQLTKLSSTLMKGTSADKLLDMVKTPAFLETFKSLAAECTGKNASDFAEMGLGDWMELLAVMKDVIGFERIQQLFSQLIPNLMEKGTAALLKQS